MSNDNAIASLEMWRDGFAETACIASAIARAVRQAADDGHEVSDAARYAGFELHVCRETGEHSLRAELPYLTRADQAILAYVQAEDYRVTLRPSSFADATAWEVQISAPYGGVQ